MSHQNKQLETLMLIDQVSGGSPTVRASLLRAVRDHGIDVITPFSISRRELLTDTQNSAYSDAAREHISSIADYEEFTDEMLERSTFPPSIINSHIDDVPAMFAPAVERFASNWRAQSTLDRYRTAWLQITDLCTKAGVAALPMSIGTAKGVISEIAHSGYKYGTVRNSLCAIRFVHKELRLPDPTRDVSFARTWAGIGRELGTGSPNARLALMRSELGLMIAAAEADGNLAAATILGLGYESAARSEELTALRVESTIEYRGEMRLWIDRSKTDQTGEGAEVIVKTVPGASFDAVQMIRDWKRHIDRKSGPLFAGCDLKHGAPLEPICSRSILRVVKRYVARAGLAQLPLNRVGSHSLRAGWATQSLIDGVPEAVVASTLRHADLSTLLRYYRPTLHRNLTRFAADGELEG